MNEHHVVRGKLVSTETVIHMYAISNPLDSEIKLSVAAEISIQLDRFIL